MPTEFVMLPPQTEKTREWGARLAAALPELKVVVAENHTHAAQVIAHADAAFGTIPPDLLREAQRLRWLQAPQAAPPAGYYYPELIAHPVAITNFREIYNDHIGAHVMAFVLAFARGLHHYIPQQLRREWKKLPQDTGVVHLPEATALVVGVGGIGSEVARLAAAFGMRVIGVDERRRDAPPGVAELHRGDELDALLPQADFVILTVPHTPGDRRLYEPRAVSGDEEDRVLHQYRARHDDPARRSRRGIRGRRDRRRRPRRLRAGAAARRPPAVDHCRACC